MATPIPPPTAILAGFNVPKNDVIGSANLEAKVSVPVPPPGIMKAFLAVDSKTAVPKKLIVD